MAQRRDGGRADRDAEDEECAGHSRRAGVTGDERQGQACDASNGHIQQAEGRVDQA
jgi:hypothetical protein